MRWYDLAYMKLAVVLVIIALLAESKTMLGQVCALIAFVAVVVDFLADHYSEEDE